MTVEEGETMPFLFVKISMLYHVVIWYLHRFPRIPYLIMVKNNPTFPKQSDFYQIYISQVSRYRL